MSRFGINVTSEAKRTEAMRMLARADLGDKGFSVTFKRNKRTLDQNALMWEYLGRIAKQVEWYGQFLDPEDWKAMFTASLRRTRVVPGIDGGTFVPLGMSTSDMTVAEMSDLITLIVAFADERNVDLGEPEARRLASELETNQ